VFLAILQIFSPEISLIRDQVWINVDAYGPRVLFLTAKLSTNWSLKLIFLNEMHIHEYKTNFQHTLNRTMDSSK